MPAERRLLAALMALTPGPPAAAFSGLDISAEVAREEFSFPAGTAAVDWQQVVLTPWWSSGHWRAEATLPYLFRDATASGTVLVWRRVDGVWMQVPLTIEASQSDSGPGDARVSVTRSWQLRENLQPYLSAQLKLPTGKEDTTENSLTLSSGTSSTSRSGAGAFSFGTGSTDLRLAPGLMLQGERAWVALEASYTWFEGGDMDAESVGGAYAGLGLLPMHWLELAVELDIEETRGDEALEQWTWSLFLHPVQRYTISLSTRDSNADIASDVNWTLTLTARF